MPKVVFFGLSLLAISTAGACSSQSDDDLGNGGTGGLINIGSGGGIGVGSTGSTTLDGGQVPITADQVTKIKTNGCAGESVEGEALPSVMELVIDTSSSMNQQAPGSNQSKWEVTRAALLDAIVGTTGPGLPGSVGIGLIFYPNKTAKINAQPGPVTDCVNINGGLAPALLGGATAPQRQAVRNAISQVQLQQSTPSHDAYKWAFENAISTTNVPGRRFMLLITDGTPTLSLGCVNQTGSLSDVDPTPIVDEIRRTAAAGIKTFLIGSPGSEANRRWMSQAAVIGGTGPAGCQVNGPNWCHMDMTTAPNFSAALAEGLRQITGQLSSCDYNFPPPPSGQTISPSNINVILTSGGASQLVVRDDVAECTKGWQLTSDGRIHLCSETCQSVQSDPNMRVDVVFGCESVGRPPE